MNKFNSLPMFKVKYRTYTDTHLRIITTILRYCIIIFFVIGLCWFSSGKSIFSQDVPHAQLEQVQQLHENGDTEAALRILDELLKQHDTFARAHLLRAEMYLDSDDWRDWEKAERSAREATHLDWKNPNYHFMLAKVYEIQGQWYNARQQYKKVLKFVPEHAEAHFRLGKLYRDQWHFYGTMVSPQDILQLYDSNMLGYIRNYMQKYGDARTAPSIMSAEISHMPDTDLLSNQSYSDILSTQFSGSGVISLENFGREDLGRARKHFDLALTHQPDEWRALLQLGLLSMEEDRMEEIDNVISQLEQREVDETDALLFLGLAYYHIRNYRQSRAYFTDAILRLQPEVRAIYATPLYVLPADGIDAQDEEMHMQRAHETDTLTFWKSRDPSFLTEENERLLAHYARCAHAYFRFSFPSRNINGLLTHRGKVYVRYGEPLQVLRHRPDKTLNYYELWYYQDKTFAFDDFWGDGRSGYKLAHMPYISFYEIAREEFSRDPEEYRLNSRGVQFNLNPQIVAFRGESGRTALQLYYQQPISGDDVDSDKDNLTAEFQVGLFQFDRDWSTITRNVNHNVYTGFELPDSSEIEFIPGTANLESEAGGFHLSLESKNHKSGNFSSFRDSIHVRSFTGDSLMISDLLLAKNISNPEQVVRERTQLSVMPDPKKEFRTHEPIHLYYEVYNLRRSSTRFSTSLEIEQIQKQRKGLSGLFSAVGDMFRKQADGVLISRTSEMSGNSSVERILTALDVSQLEPGRYRLNLHLQDLNSKQMATSSGTFSITDSTAK